MKREEPEGNPSQAAAHTSSKAGSLRLSHFPTDPASSFSSRDNDKFGSSGSSNVSQKDRAVKRKCSSWINSKSKLARRIATAYSNASHNDSLQESARSLYNISAAGLTELCLPTWPHGRSEVAIHLGFSLDDKGFREWTTWIESSVVAQHYERLREVFKKGLLIGANPRPLFPTITEMVFKDERHVGSNALQIHAENR